MRPANIVTAIADILAGVSAAGLLSQGVNPEILWLILSTMGLYGGGVVFNDILDRDLDKVERPERPLPSGQVSVSAATILALTLFLIGIIAAFLVSAISGTIAVVIAVLAIVYDKFAKHNVLLGPINMGLCRSFNLLLGMSIAVNVLTFYWYLAFIPLIFVGDITLTSQGEVKGKNRSLLRLALGLDFVVIAMFIGLTFLTRFDALSALVFLALWLAMNSTYKIKAMKDNQPKMIRMAVKMGVLSLIPLNAAIVAGFEGWLCGVLVLLLLPLSLGLAKYFAVT